MIDFKLPLKIVTEGRNEEFFDKCKELGCYYYEVSTDSSVLEDFKSSSFYFINEEGLITTDFSCDWELFHSIKYTKWSIEDFLSVTVKEPLVKGKWYKSVFNSIICYQGDGNTSYGFTPDGMWMSYFGLSGPFGIVAESEADNFEVYKKLSEEAERRYGKNWENKNYNGKLRDYGNYAVRFDYKTNVLYGSKGVDVFNNGVWNDVVEEEPQKFYTYQKVLVRNSDNEDWHPEFYGKKDLESDRHATLSGWYYYQCIPYKGNTDLAFANNKPKK